jgi:hypothetical protein
LPLCALIWAPPSPTKDDALPELFAGAGVSTVTV